MDQRREPRHPVLLRVEYRSGQALLADYATDIGKGGLFVRTDHPFTVGESIVLSLSFPGVLEATQLSGNVRWCRSSAEAAATGQPQGVGVAFSPDCREGCASLSRLVERLAMKAPVPPRERSFDVLLVEDNRFVQDLFRHALNRFHHGHSGGAEAANLRIHAALTAHEAIRLMQTVRPQLAIVDHLLPGLSGARLVQRMRADPLLLRVPILVVSAGGKEARAEALEAGATVYLDKPVLLAQLVATISSMLMGES